MNTIKYTIILGLFSLFLVGTSCKKTLDINTDPNNPSLDQGNPRLLFPAGVMSVAGRVGGDIAILGGIWGQYVTQSAQSNQYKYIDAYNVKSNDLNAQYTGLFTGGLKNFQAVIDKSKVSADWNFYLMGTVMKAYTATMLVDLYDKIPFFESLQGATNLNPKFDDGYEIYKAVLAEIDTALNKDFNASTNTSAGSTDLIFGGDINKWKQFANTLELKLYLRMINAKPSEAMAGVQKLYSKNASFLDTEAGVFGYTDAPGLNNPLYEQNIRQLNTPNNLRASRTYVSYLTANGDPRVITWFGTSTPNSINQGDYLGTDATYATAATFVQKPTEPVIFISLAESYFLQAEARERYYSGAGAKALYDQGVITAFTEAGQNGNSFVAAGGRYEYPVAGTFEEKQEAISTQKWASFPYGAHFIEGYFEKQRTGYPRSSAVYSSDASYVPGRFVVSKNSVLNAGLMPRRLVLPDVEITRNSNAPAQVLITAPVWWAKP